ncbi:putative RNA helicase [Rosa chinensis]|uniref:Putative RNA helicase n=1 Tax=Rosa chinensis TaxID=74649 RepID=A0A2P6PD13_ROSCH|nr:putative RNA helicase [Rosa chinensis]
MFNGVFTISSLMFCLVGKTKRCYKTKEEIDLLFLQLQETARRVAEVQLQFFSGEVEIDIDSFVSSFRPDIMEATYAWAEGSKFYEIMSDFEGSLIRAIRRLEEVLQQLIHAANSIGEIDLLRRLFQKLRETLSLQLPYTW